MMGAVATREGSSGSSDWYQRRPPSTSSTTADESYTVWFWASTTRTATPLVISEACTAGEMVAGSSRLSVFA